ncbi:SAG-related sequence [Besnoitia besnoiti]|uniref:SAG-related sequence n=1 Tax=Besnoitia besnoiti TaxID=94643 RepID=A0A2A9MKX1_BESBE|nr:SAG-related sequence [Besnoitia besnoiti]PFH36082.1 SAG-related sequence [Besnoitia besnoiti]
MASGGCSASLAASGTTKGKKQWKDSSFPLAKLVPLSILASLVICFGFQSFSTVRAVTAQTVTTDCVPEDNKTTCSCEEQGVKESGKQLSAILSKDRSVLTVDCKGALKFAPKVAADNRVCSAQEDLPACTLSLHKLLAGNSPDVNWTECETNGKTKGECKSLSIPQERLPFTDQQFAVGCVSADNQKKCRVAVTMKARASLTEGQTVTCAYGAGSNQLHQTVKLNPTHNSFTLVCGEKGEVFPQKYDETFCTSEPKGNEEACSGNYQSVLPGYEKDWWKEDKKARSFTFSIPVDQFPREPTKIIVGCQHSEKSSTDQESDEEVPAPTACSVDVTIESRASALSAAIIGELSLLWGVSAVAFFTCTY